MLQFTIIMSSKANAIAINLKTNRQCGFRTRLVRQGMTDDTYYTYNNTFSTQVLLNSPLCIRVSSLIRTRPSKRNNPSRSIAFFPSRASTAHTSPASMRHVFPSHGHFASAAYYTSSHYGCPAEQLGAGIETFFLTPGYVISVSSENICRNSLSTPPYLRRRLSGRRHFARRACAVSHRLTVLHPSRSRVLVVGAETPITSPT